MIVNFHGRLLQLWCDKKVIEVIALDLLPNSDFFPGMKIHSIIYY